MLSLTIEFRVDTTPAGPVTVAMANAASKVASIAVPATLAASKVGEWTTRRIPLQCFAKQGIDVARVATTLVPSSGGASVLAAVHRADVNVAMNARAR